jgi:short-subunit dehydrogenase
MVAAPTPPSSIFISGASSGLGAALARGYARPETTLHLHGRSDARLQSIAQDCSAKGATVYHYQADVSDAKAMQELVLRADDTCPITLMIANAGVSASSSGYADMIAQDYAIFQTNLMGVLHTIHPMIPRMQARGGGHLALMSSMAAYHPLSAAPAYSASKAALWRYGEALMKPLSRDNIALSVICPGFIDTPLTRHNRFYMPFLMNEKEAVARIICGLAKKHPHIAFPKRLVWPLRLMGVLPLTLRRFLL